MKKQNKWSQTKYIRNKNGQLIASRDAQEVAVNSRLIADLTAAWYDTNIKEFAKGELLDLGCGKAPLYGSYAPYTSSVTLADWGNSLHKNVHLDVVCDITKKLPFKNNSFDTIILSDVLEHVPNPEKVITEVARVLKPSGSVLINVPFMYGLHEVPYDYHRYTEFMLGKLIEDAGMNMTKIEALGGGYAVLINLVSKLSSGRKVAVIQKVLTKAFSKKLKARPEFPIAYALVCQKGKAK